MIQNFLMDTIYQMNVIISRLFKYKAFKLITVWKNSSQDPTNLAI